MRCARHPETEAFAICRACFKGVCPTCAVPAGRSVACSAECAEEAARLVRLVATSSRNTPAVQRTQAAVLLVLALVTGIAALVATDAGRWVLATATGLLILGAFRFFRLAAHWRGVERG